MIRWLREAWEDWGEDCTELLLGVWVILGALVVTVSAAKLLWWFVPWFWDYLP